MDAGTAHQFVDVFLAIAFGNDVAEEEKFEQEGDADEQAIHVADEEERADPIIGRDGLGAVKDRKDDGQDGDARGDQRKKAEHLVIDEP